MKKIILPTDFSENAYNAIMYAVKLFEHVESTFYLLNTYTPTIYQPEYLIHSPGQIGLGDMYQENSRAQLAELKKKIEKAFKNPKHTFIPHSAFNLLVDEIAATATNENANMVIMGTQGATGAEEIFLGSNTVHVLNKVNCPVIAVPSGFAYKQTAEILFPTDYEVDYRKEQLQELMDIAAAHKAHIDVIHVSTGYEPNLEQQKNKDTLTTLFKELDHTCHDLPDQTVISAINGFQAGKPMDLLVMIQNKHTFFERLFIEPVIKKIGFHTTIPFMVLPHTDE